MLQGRVWALVVQGLEYGWKLGSLVRFGLDFLGSGVAGPSLGIGSASPMRALARSGRTQIC